MQRERPPLTWCYLLFVFLLLLSKGLQLLLQLGHLLRLSSLAALLLSQLLLQVLNLRGREVGGGEKEEEGRREGGGGKVGEREQGGREGVREEDAITARSDISR